MNAVPSTSLDLLVQLVSFNTVNESAPVEDFPEEALLLYLEELAKAWGFETKRLLIESSPEDRSFNLLITPQIQRTGPWLLFESHADTVSVKGMTELPFSATIKENRIYGRGVCDTKGSAAAMLWALKSYSAQSENPNNIAILLVTDEENHKRGANAFVQKQLPQLPWKPVGIIVGEPSESKMIVAHNGVFRMRIRTKGIAAHSSNPSIGKSAITSMAMLILLFEEEYCSRINLSHPLTGKAACSINTIHGGTYVNIIPEFCEIEIDRRVLPGEDIKQIQADIDGILQHIMETNSSIEIELSEPFIDYPLDSAVGPTFGKIISSALNELGLSGEHLGVAYGSDASTYSAVGIPAIVIGPGSIDQAHTKDEWLEISEIEKAVSVYLQIMKIHF